MSTYSSDEQCRLTMPHTQTDTYTHSTALSSYYVLTLRDILQYMIANNEQQQQKQLNTNKLNK